MAKLAHVMRFFVTLLLFGHLGDCTSERSIINDEMDALTSVLKESLISLGQNATKPQPKFGLDLPIDPLYAVAPLRYLHEGDLLKLRLQLNNVSLEGLSSLTLQEVSFALPSRATFNEPSLPPTPTTSNPQQDRKVIDPSSYDFLPELKDREESAGTIGGTDIEDYDYYDDVEEDEYEITSNHAFRSSDANEVTKKEMPFMDDFNAINGATDLKTEEEEEEEGTDEYEVGNGNEMDAKTFQDMFLRGYDDAFRTNGAERYKRHLPFSGSSHSRHSKRAHMRRKPKKDDLEESVDRSIYQRNDRITGNLLSPLPGTTHGSSPRPHNYRHSPNRAMKKRTVELPGTRHQEEKQQRKRLRSKLITVNANVRVAFSDVKIRAQYIIKGRAGGVFTFKEQGRLVLTIPHVFLTSQFNVTLIPEFKGLRHWKNSRRNHVRVQKVRSRLSLDVPRLSLIPVSRPSEWVRRQLQEKMEELGKGVGKRDGAIRLLLRHWARLLRRLVTKASKQSWIENRRGAN